MQFIIFIKCYCSLWAYGSINLARKTDRTSWLVHLEISELMNSDYMQLGGLCTPEETPLTCRQLEVAGPPWSWYTKSMLWSSMSEHGILLLQMRLTATFVLEVPRMFLNFTFLISTCDSPCIERKEDE